MPLALAHWPQRWDEKTTTCSEFLLLYSAWGKLLLLTGTVQDPKATCYTGWTQGSRSPARWGHPGWRGVLHPDHQCGHSGSHCRDHMGPCHPSPRSYPSCCRGGFCCHLACTERDERPSYSQRQDSAQTCIPEKRRSLCISRKKAHSLAVTNAKPESNLAKEPQRDSRVTTTEYKIHMLWSQLNENMQISR